MWRERGGVPGTGSSLLFLLIIGATVSYLANELREKSPATVFVLFEENELEKAYLSLQLSTCFHHEPHLA